MSFLLIVHIFAQWLFFLQMMHVVTQAGHLSFHYECVPLHLPHKELLGWCLIVLISWLILYYILASCFMWQWYFIVLSSSLGSLKEIIFSSLERSCFCNSGWLVLNWSALFNYFISWVSWKLDFLAYNLHLARMLSMFSSVFCASFCRKKTSNSKICLRLYFFCKFLLNDN